MSKFTIKTESGATYVVDTTRGGWSFGASGVRRLTTFMAALKDEPMLPWIAPEDWEDVSEPVVGRQMYLSGRREWRISTNVVSVRQEEW